MADLSDNNAAQTVKLVGANSSGVEQTPIKSSINGDLSTSDLLNVSGLQAALTVGLTSVELKVGATKLASRKVVTLYNNSNSTVYWGYTSGVTVASGTPIFKNQFISWDVGDIITLFVISDAAGSNVRITEAS